MRNTEVSNEETKMFSEAGEAGARVQEQLARNRDGIEEISHLLASDKVTSVITCARGSSSHATVYGKYLLEPLIAKPVSAFSPSMASIFKARLNLKGTLFLAVSQSGRSEDLLRSVENAKKGGAVTVALTNAQDSPLSQMSDLSLPLWAGPELSVAATKSFICSLTALASIAFAAGKDEVGARALEALPESLVEAWQGNWDVALPALASANSLFVTSRGAGLGIAKEAALKLKETSGLHAEALSAAELRHGPMAVVSDGFPILAFVPSDVARESVQELVSYSLKAGANCIVIGASHPGALDLQCPVADDARLTPIVQIQRFYRFANALSLARGRCPDAPPFLKKVTVTV